MAKTLICSFVFWERKKPFFISEKELEQEAAYGCLWNGRVVLFWELIESYLE